MQIAEESPRSPCSHVRRQLAVPAGANSTRRRTPDRNCFAVRLHYTITKRLPDEDKIIGLSKGGRNLGDVNLLPTNKVDAKIRNEEDTDGNERERAEYLTLYFVADAGVGR